MLSSTFKVTWKWGNDRDVSWKSFSGLASSNSNSSRTRDVGVAGGGTQFCWTSGLSTRMTSQFVDESSFRCRLLLNAQDAGRWVWFLNVAHELFLVKKLKQQTMETTSQGVGVATTAKTPEGGDTLLMVVLAVVALVLMVLLALALFFMYRRMTRAERARRRRKERIRARAIEASAKLREELNEDLTKRPFDARSGSSGSSRSGSSSKGSSVHFSDADIVWDPTSSSRTVLRTNLSDSEKGSKWRNSPKIVLQGSRRTSHDVAKEYRARRALQIRSRRSSNASAEEFGVGSDHSKDGRRSDGRDRSRASRYHSNKTDSSDHFRENVSRQHFRSQDEPSAEDPSYRLRPADPVSSPKDAAGVTKVAETNSAKPERDSDQASTVDEEEDFDDASSYASSDAGSSCSES